MPGIDPMFNASYNDNNAPLPPPYGIGASNQWLSNQTHMNSGSCAPSGLSQTCTVGYQGGGQLNIGEKAYLQWLVSLVETVTYSASFSASVSFTDGDSSVTVSINATEVDEFSYSLFPQDYLSTMTPALPKATPPCGGVNIKAIMTQWNNALQAWIKAHPGQAPPPSVATPPISSQTCGGVRTVGGIAACGHAQRSS
jgi:hypothetical protein